MLFADSSGKRLGVGEEKRLPQKVYAFSILA
jgi:hypothetical protein